MDSEFYECPECKTRVKTIHRETHDLYCRNSIKASEYANLIPCEICGNLINFDDFMTHMETCGRASLPPPGLLNFMNSFPPLNNINRNTDTDEENEESNEELESDNESINNTQNNIPPLPFPPSVNNNIQEQIIELLRNVTEIDNLIDTNNSNENLNRVPFSMLFTLNNSNNTRRDQENNPENDYQTFTDLINQIGNVSTGIDDINKVTTIEVKKIDCPICGDEHEIIRRTSCGHEFCYNCLNEWIRENKTCPVCSLELKEL